MAKQIRISAKLDKSGFQKELNKLLKKEYEINLNDNSFKAIINDISKNADKITGKLNNIGKGSFDEVTKNAQKSASAFENLAEAMGKLREKSQLRVKSDESNWQLKQAQAVNKALDEQYALQQKQAQQREKLEQDYDNTWQRLLKNRELQEEASYQKSLNNINKLKEQLQGKLNTASNNNLVDSSVISKLQSQLDSINVDSAEKEINELKNVINNLNSSESGIIRVQQAIIKIEEKLSNLKNTKIDLINSADLSEIKGAEEELEKLKNTLNSLKNGEVINGKAISNQINEANNSVRTLSNSFSDLNGSGGKLSSTMQEMFAFAIGGTGIYAVIDGFKNASNVVRELDESMISLKKVTSETDSVYKNFLSNMHNVALELGTQSSAMVDATTNWAKTGESLEDASKLAESTVLLTKVGDIDDVNTAQSYMVGILKSFNIEAEKSITLIDKYNNLSNNMATETRDLGAGMNIAANSLAVAGNTLDEALALMAAGSATTQQSGETIGNALKTISLRISEFKTEDGELIPKLAEDFKRLGVETVDSAGQIRSTFDILKDIGKIYKDLSRNEQLSLSESIGGKHQANIVASILSQIDELEKAYDLASDSAGSALKEFETYKEGVAYSIDQLKEQLNGLYMNFMNSDFLKGLTDSVAGTIKLFNSLGSTIGSFPTSVTMATGAMTILNKSFRENLQVMTSAMPIIGGLQDKYLNYVSGLEEAIKKTKEEINAKKIAIATNIQTGESTKTLSQEVVALQKQLAVTTIKTTTLKVAMIALQAVATSLMSLGISLVVSGLSKLADSLITTKSELQEMNQQSLTTLNDNNELISSVEQLVQKEKELQDKINASGTTYKQQNEYKAELLDVQRQIATILPETASGFDSEGNKISANTDAVLENLDAKKKLSERESLNALENNKYDVKDIINNYKTLTEQYNEMQEAYKNGQEYNGVEVTNKMLDKMNKQITEYEDKIKVLKPALETLMNSGWTDDRLMEEVFPKLPDDFPKDEIKSAFTELITIITEYGTTVDDVTEKTGDAGKQQISDVEILEQTYKNLGYSVDEIKEKIEEFNSLNNDVDISNMSVEEATKAYSESLTKAQEIYDLIEAINEEQAMTPALISQVASEYPQLGSAITSVSDVQEFLNNKLKEQEDVSNQAFETMVANDNNYYQNKLLQDEAWQENFRQSLIAMGMSQEDAYKLDFKNFENLNQLKTYSMNELGDGIEEWLSQYIDISNDGYGIDFSNFKSFSQAKLAVLSALNQEIKKVTQNLATAELMTNTITAMQNTLPNSMFGSRGEFYDTVNNKAQQNVDAYTQKLKDLQGALKEVEDNFSGIGASGLQFSGSSFNPISPSSSGSGNKGSNSSSSSKEVADLEDLTNRYHDLEDAITDYSNALSFNKLLQNNANDKSKINLMKQEIELYKKQADAVKKLNEEQKKEAKELKSALSKQGVKFDSSGDISNYNTILKTKTNWANSLSGEAKESAIEQVKELESALKRYDELVNDLIPKQEQEWQSLQNSISDVNDAIKDMYKDQLDLVASQEKEIANMIEYYAKKKVDAKKEAVEKELELEKKRLEGLKESLSKEKDLYNKNIEEENYEADLAKERNKLAEIQAEIDRLSMASDAKSKAMLQNLLQQYDEQQKVISDKIKEHQQQATNDRFDQEMELLDKELEDTEDKFDKILEQIDKDLEEYLNPENLNNIIQNALKTGMVDIMGTTVQLQSAMNDMIKDTEVGFINASTQIGSFIENLKEVKDLYGSINTIMAGSGLTANLPSNIGTRSVQVSVGDLIVQGNIDSDVLSDVQAMLNKQADEIYKNINKALSTK